MYGPDGSPRSGSAVPPSPQPLWVPGTSTLPPECHRGHFLPVSSRLIVAVTFAIAFVVLSTLVRHSHAGAAARTDLTLTSLFAGLAHAPHQPPGMPLRTKTMLTARRALDPLRVPRATRPWAPGARHLSRLAAGKQSVPQGVIPDIVLAPFAPHTATVIFLHGLGDTGSGWKDAFEAIQPLLPHVKFLLPSAEQQPVSLNGGMPMPSWFDIQSLTEMDQDPHTGLDETVRRVHMLVDQETREHGIPPSRVVVGGFSQGGAVSLYGGYSYDAGLAGILALSTWLPRAGQFVDEATEEAFGTPFLMCHGQSDEVVQFAYGERSFAALQSSGRNGKFRSFEGLGHSLNMDELRAVADWLVLRLPAQ